MDDKEQAVKEILEEFSAEIDNDELDLSSCEILDVPTELFENHIVYRIQKLNIDHNNLQNIDTAINQLINLVELTLVGNSLMDLPNEITELSKLRELNINENNIVVLPESINGLESLTILSAVGNDLSRLPISFTKLVNLKEVYLDENKIETLPEGFHRLKNLKIFEVANNQLSSLPHDIGYAVDLEILNLNTNWIEIIPDSLSLLEKLKILDLSNNKIASLPNSFESSSNIEKLYLENNSIKSLPNWFSNLVKLEELTISDNSLFKEQFGDGFCMNSKRLKLLEAGANFMESLSDKFGNLVNLETLHLGSTISELERSNFQNGNWIKILPESVCDLRNLTKMNINENQIASLPKCFGQIISLTWLDLGQNMLEYLPESLCDLVNLEFLQLSKNQLKELPQNIGNLVKLMELRLDDNLLTKIPDSLGTIKDLNTLDLFHNKLNEIPKVIFKLTKLKRLDIDQNSFKMNLADIPKLVQGNKYPDRDPSLKDNWRGKTRPDKVFCTGNIVEINATPPNEEEDEPEVQWNENALRMAIRNGRSLWRSHNDKSDHVHLREAVPRPSIREVSTKIIDVPDLKPNITGKAINDDEWIACTYEINTHKNKRKQNMKNKDPTIEDWDEEIEEIQDYKQIMNVFNERKTKNSKAIDSFQNSINRYPPASQAYTTTANYESFVYKNVTPVRQYKTFVATYIEGQFDDIE